MISNDLLIIGIVSIIGIPTLICAGVIIYNSKVLNKINLDKINNDLKDINSKLKDNTFKFTSHSNTLRNLNQNFSSYVKADIIDKNNKKIKGEFKSEKKARERLDRELQELKNELKLVLET
jgi:uncharacterized protein YabN with tetrapyrrole methylase and pyrophosphatase domain